MSSKSEMKRLAIMKESMTPSDLENTRKKCEYHMDHEVIFTVKAMKKMIGYIDILTKPKETKEIDFSSDGPEGYELISTITELRQKNLSLTAENAALKLKLRRAFD